GCSDGAGNHEQRPLAGHAFENVGTAALEADSGAGHEILGRTGDENLPGRRGGRDARSDVHGDSTDLFTEHLTFTGVETTTDLDAERPDLIADAGRTANSARRAIERGEQAIASSVDLAPPESCELAPGDAVVPFQQFAPLSISKCDCAFGG